MTNDFSWTEFDCMLKDLFTPNGEDNAKEQQRMIMQVFNRMVELASSWEGNLWENVHDNGNLILDLEHIIAVGADRIETDRLPEELRNLSPEEYLEQLAHIVKKRRWQKDLAAIYRTIKQRCGNVVNFISGMNDRKYDVRYKNPNYAPTSGDEQAEFDDGRTDKLVNRNNMQTPPKYNTPNVADVKKRAKEQQYVDKLHKEKPVGYR